MDTEHTDSKNDIMQNQEDAMRHLVKATNKLDESNRKVSKEYTEEVRLEVKGEGNGKTEAIERLDNRLEHLEQNLIQIINNQRRIFKQLEKKEAEQQASKEKKSADEDDSKGYKELECGICNKKIGVRGFVQHIKGQHNVDIEEIFKEGDKYKAEGFEASTLKELTNKLTNYPEAKNLTQLIAQKLQGKHEEERENKETEYACSICGETYGDKRGMAAHLNKSHHLSGEGVVDKNIREPKTYETTQDERKDADREGDFQCPYCDKVISHHALARHLNLTHPEETGMRDFFRDEEKQVFSYRDVEHEDWQKFRNRFGNLELNPTEAFIDELEKEGSEEEKEELEEQVEEQEEEQDNISDYERAKRNASVSDRDMQIAEQSIHKIIHDHLDNIPDSNEKFISYTGNENIPGFETLYAGDLRPLNMWRKIFSNTGLLTGINERVAENHELTWERKGTKGTPKNWVIKVQRTDK